MDTCITAGVIADEAAGESTETGAILDTGLRGGLAAGLLRATRDAAETGF